MCVAVCYDGIVLTVTYSHRAIRDLRGLPRQDAARVVAKIERYAADPGSLAHQVVRLQGSRTLRLRVGAYRAVFERAADTVTGLLIGHRRSIYR